MVLTGGVQRELVGHINAHGPLRRGHDGRGRAHHDGSPAAGLGGRPARGHRSRRRRRGREPGHAAHAPGAGTHPGGLARRTRRGRTGLQRQRRSRGVGPGGGPRRRAAGDTHRRGRAVRELAGELRGDRADDRRRAATNCCRGWRAGCCPRWKAACGPSGAACAGRTCSTAACRTRCCGASLDETSPGTTVGARRGLIGPARAAVAPERDRLRRRLPVLRSASAAPTGVDGRAHQSDARAPARCAGGPATSPTTAGAGRAAAGVNPWRRKSAPSPVVAVNRAPSDRARDRASTARRSPAPTPRPCRCPATQKLYRTPAGPSSSAPSG